jgi:hypothetical protein
VLRYEYFSLYQIQDVICFFIILFIYQRALGNNEWVRDKRSPKAGGSIQQKYGFVVHASDRQYFISNKHLFL